VVAHHHPQLQSLHFKHAHLSIACEGKRHACTDWERQRAWRPDIVRVRELNDADALVLVDVGEGRLPGLPREIFQVLPRGGSTEAFDPHLHPHTQDSSAAQPAKEGIKRKKGTHGSGLAAVACFASASRQPSIPQPSLCCSPAPHRRRERQHLPTSSQCMAHIAPLGLRMLLPARTRAPRLGPPSNS
jgi:hypothetical protein